MTTQTNSIWLNTGTVVAAFGASLCCILPVAVVFLGVGSAALGATLEPYRAHFAVLTIALLGFAFYQAYKPQKVECAPGESCAVPENRQRQRLLLWIVAAIALALVTFPYYVGWIL
ncbi:MAG: mercury transporter [Acidobacteria bacterium]|nr:mercury transporter [Acidobacteriota bacterium]